MIRSDYELPFKINVLKWIWFITTFWRVTKKPVNAKRIIFISTASIFFKGAFSIPVISSLGIKALLLWEFLKPIRPRPNVKLFIWRNQTWWIKFVNSSTSSSVKFIWMTLDWSFNTSFWRWSPGETSIFTCGKLSQTNKLNLYADIVCLYWAPFGRKFVTDLIRLIDSTHLKFDVWPNRRS